MKKIIPGVIILLCIYCASHAQSENGISSIKQLTDSIKAIVQQDHIPGLMLGITTKDSILFSGGFGYADINAKRPVNSQSLFRLGSISKMFVSLAILKLVQEGRLKLDDPLKKIVPEVPFQNQWEATHPVRIINLLEHTAGFDDMKLNHMCSTDTFEYTGMDMVLLQKNSLVCRWKPGERFAYSNPDYVLLGYIIQKITGKYYERYIAENILKPLGMYHSNFNPESKLPEDVNEYVVHDGMPKEVPSVNCLMAPAGALWSSSADMIKFLQMFLNNGEPIFAESVINEMETPLSSLAAGKGLKSGYAMGNYDMLFYNKYTYHGHSGLMGTCYSSFIYNRELGVGFIISSNGNQPNYKIENAVTSFLEQNKPGRKTGTTSLDIKAVTPFLGSYKFENPRNEISGFKDKLLFSTDIFIENNTLYIRQLFAEKVKLLQTAPLTFEMEGANEPTVIFTKNEEGKNVAIINNGYFEQTSSFGQSFNLWITIIAIFFAAFSLIPGIVSIIAALIGKLKLQKLSERILPMSALLLLVWAVNKLLEVQSETYLLSELTNINSRTLIIFSGTLLFGILTLANMILVVRKSLQMKNKWITFYWAITALSLCYIAIVLLQNGWIGLRTWLM